MKTTEIVGEYLITKIDGVEVSREINTVLPPECDKPYKWLIDVGTFFDRFGAAKFAVLTSTDLMVQAIVKDTQVRKWVDLKNPATAQGIDLLISKGIAGVTAELKTAILDTPVSAVEQMALVKNYFS